MYKEIAAFPLPMACFPGETQNLHIFEPRYRALIQDCIVQKINFAIVPVNEGNLFTVATEMELKDVVKEYEDGKYDISVRALRVLKLKSYKQQHREKAYPGIQFSTIRWNSDSVYSNNEKIVSLIHELYTIIHVENAKIPAATDFRLWKVVHKIGLSLDQELELLKISNGIKRQEYVINHLEKLIPTLKIAEELKVKAALNGHFKNISSGNLF